MTDKLMFCLIEDNNLLGKYNISADTKKKKQKLIGSLSTIKPFLKTKIKSHGDEVRDFYTKFLLWTLIILV